MAAAYSGGCDAVTIDGIGADGRALVISFSKYGDHKSLKKYAGDLLMKVFPALGAKYVYSAVSTDGVSCLGAMQKVCHSKKGHF